MINNKKIIMLDFLTLSKQEIQKKYNLTDQYFDLFKKNQTREYMFLKDEKEVMKMYNSNTKITSNKIAKNLKITRARVIEILFINGVNCFKFKI